MNPYLKNVKKSVRDLSAYTLRHFDAEVKINQNENPFDVPQIIKDEVAALLKKRSWSRYPEFSPARTTQKLADHVGWHADGLLIGNGSNELLKSLFSALISRGKTVVSAQPSFAVYKLLNSLLDGRWQPCLLTSNFQFPVDALVDAARNADLTILCSPNNPTGSVLAQRDLKKILEATDGIVAADQAYLEFGGEDFLSLLPQHKNLVIFRTFSKAMAMAGLRLGYMLADPELTREIAKAKLPYNVNFVTLAAAEIALEHFSLLQEVVQKILALRQKLGEALTRLADVEVFPSQANFFLFRTPYEAHDIFDELYARRVLVRDVSHGPLLDRGLRVSVGTKEENETFVGALEAAMRKLRAQEERVLNL